MNIDNRNKGTRLIARIRNWYRPGSVPIKPLVIRVPRSFIKQIRSSQSYPLSHVRIVEDDGEIMVEAVRWKRS